MGARAVVGARRDGPSWRCPIFRRVEADGRFVFDFHGCGLCFGALKGGGEAVLAKSGGAD